jgi:phosphatidylserine decarboxylase
MAQTIKEWLPTVKKIKHQSRAVEDHETFFHDPARPNFIDGNFFFTPADGIIIYQEVVKNPKDAIIEVKGKKFTLQQLLQDEEYNKPSAVVGVFMTEYDQHVNHIPYSGVLRYKKCDCLATMNLPMLDTQKGLLKKVIDPSAIAYMHKNERVVNRIFSPVINHEYYVVQIADLDVDCICHFNTDRSVSYSQNQRFSMIRWGSQCDLVVPLSKKFDLEFCLEPMMHVEARWDKLIKIVPKKGTHDVL